MRHTAQKPLGRRTLDHKEVLAALDSSMERSDYTELLVHIALAYKELTDAMAHMPIKPVRSVNISTVVSTIVSFLRITFPRGPSPTDLRLIEARARLSKAERQLGHLVAGYLPTTCTLFDPEAPQLVLPELGYRTRPAA